MGQVNGTAHDFAEDAAPPPPDERVVWVRENWAKRKVILLIEGAPTGFSVTTQWWDAGKMVRQDVEVAIRDASTQGKAKEM